MALILAIGRFGCALAAETLYFPQQGSELALQQEQMAACGQQIAMLVRAGYVWAEDNEGFWPGSLRELAFDLPSPALVFCPAQWRDPRPTNWTAVDWDKVDYEWIPPAERYPAPDLVVCRCRVHSSHGIVEGSTVVGPTRAGWPAITATPCDAVAEPGARVTFGFRCARDAGVPLGIQWLRGQVLWVTNVTAVTNSYHPPVVEWTTNVSTTFACTNLPGATSPTLTLENVRAEDAAYYGLSLSNSAGASHSRPFQLVVLDAPAGLGTNAAWSAVRCATNLQQAGLLVRRWRKDHAGQMPVSFAEMTNRWGEPIFGWPASLYCLSDTNHAFPVAWEEVDLNDTSYELCNNDPFFAASPMCRCRTHRYYVEMGGGMVLGPRLLSVVQHRDGGVVFTCRIFAGGENYLEVSGNLLDWEPLAALGSWPGEEIYYDPLPRDRAFYRMRAD